LLYFLKEDSTRSACPYPEGGHDPIARSEATLQSIGEEAKEQFSIAISP